MKLHAAMELIQSWFMLNTNVKKDVRLGAEASLHVKLNYTVAYEPSESYEASSSSSNTEASCFTSPTSGADDDDNNAYIATTSSADNDVTSTTTSS